MTDLALTTSSANADSMAADLAAELTRATGRSIVFRGQPWNERAATTQAIDAGGLDQEIVARPPAEVRDLAVAPATIEPDPVLSSRR